MTSDELLRLVSEVQQHQNELNNLEVKTARGGMPERLYQSLSAFANHTGGGVILFGLDENRKFEVTGVPQVQKLQADVTSTAAEMGPALRPEFTIADVNGEDVVAVEIEEVPAAQKPCYSKPQGLQNGAFIRVGNTNRRMTEYEIFGYLSARTPPTFDEEPVADAEIDDLDRAKLEDFVAQLRRQRPHAGYLKGSLDEILTHLHIVRSTKEGLRPTLAGLLMFGRWPQEFEIQLVITFLQYFGTTEEEETPSGARFLDNQKFEGPIPQMIDDAVNRVLANMRKSSLIEGVFRRDIPEYPEKAVREALINAVAHRDYSSYVRGSYIQVRLFADRLEVQSPGGLYGNVNEENLEEEHSTRNRLLMRLLEDLHLVENRGSGIRAMLEALRRANLEPPRFQDKRSSFWVTFRNHTLMSPEAITWLNQFAALPLNDRQRLALVYLRYNDRIANPDYQRLNRVDSVTARQELRGLVQTGLVEQQNTRRWAYYTLKVAAEVRAVEPAQTDEATILAFVREHGSITNAQCRQLLSVNGDRAYYLLKKLISKRQLRRGGEKKGAQYLLR